MAEDGGISLGELAEQRGISKDAARRLVKAGKVAAHQVPSDRGPAWCCHPDGEIPERHRGASPAPGVRQGTATVAQGPRDGSAGVAQPPDVAALVALVDRLTTEKDQLAAENAELVRAVAAWQSQAVVLAGRLADAQDRLALPSPVASQTQQEAQEAPSAAPVAIERTVRRLWQRWRAWLVTGLIVAVVGSASCQMSASVKHAGLCSLARVTLDDMVQSAAGQPVGGMGYWSLANSVLDVAKQVC